MLLYVGRIAPEKGIELLLDAFDVVRQTVRDVTLVLVGDYLSARGLKPRLFPCEGLSGVIITGELRREDVAEYYDAADVFVFPSLTDTQGLVLHEAARHGLPIVMVDKELRSIVTDPRNSIVCEPEVAQLAGAILQMMHRCRDVEYAGEMASASRELASGVSSRRQALDFMRLYQRLIAASNC